MKTNALLNLAAAVMLTGLAMMSGSAVAQTPDGVTPANEGVCNALQAPGVSPGLYGLCVAYCEAQDLDSMDKAPPSTKILANYNKRRKPDTDPAMPCVKTPCPCWNSSDMAAITSDGAASACLGGATKLQIIDNVSPTRFAVADTTAGRERCDYQDQTLTPATSTGQTITAEDAIACYAEVKTACQSLGL